MNPLDPTDIAIDLSGFCLLLRGAAPDLATRLRREWRLFLRATACDALLDVRIEVQGREVPASRLSAKEMTSRFGDGTARFSMPQGDIELATDGRGRVRLAQGPVSNRFYVLVNLLCAGLAWRVPRSHALLLHAAAVVIDERAFVLVGEAGSGKTTWSELARSAGALFISDDLALVAGTEPVPSLLATPIRGDHPEPHGPRRWPLAAFLLPAHGSVPRLTPAPALALQARLAANLPFIAENLAREPAILDLVRRLAGVVPGYTLTFAREPSFVEILRTLGQP